jgi:hypothetical protein
MDRKKSINFTVVPDEKEPVEPHYANFCAVSHTPFDFTLSFCQMQPLSEKELRNAPEGSTQIVKAPVKLKIAVPVQLIPALTAALQENFRIYQDAYSNVGWGKDKKVH